ncbi:heterokaryon incompatibility protein-domain-containing protein [Hypoxylon sp. NC1633]|nr:heterokaryon incompatibility protein-domain-containing protein [Hypoxylon sp. NC1633]
MRSVLYKITRGIIRLLSGQRPVSDFASSDVASPPEDPEQAAHVSSPPSAPSDSEFDKLVLFCKESYKKYSPPHDAFDILPAVLHDLCKRDPRFSFLDAVFRELASEDDGLIEQCGRKARAAKSTLAFLEDSSADDLHIVTTAMLHHIVEYNLGGWEEKDESGFTSVSKCCEEVVTSTIYEILDTFDIGLTPGQAEAGNSASGKIGLLVSLHEKCKGLPPHPRNPPRQPFATASSLRPQHRYPCEKRLISGDGLIRVLQILPGTKDAEVQCRLKECNIHENDIEEALSYVWGEPILGETIQINEKPYLVTKRLHEILRSLRRPTAVRTIWIDAICINQQDNEEKEHQVRLMMDIYSKTKNTLIWLNDQAVPDVFKEEGMEFAPHKIPFPLPTRSDNTIIDQNDLSSILEEFQKCHVNGKLSSRLLAGIMMMRCMHYILSHTWWERIWTLQEAALPHEPPTFFFRGYSFSFDELTAAYDFNSDLIDDTNKAKTVPNGTHKYTRKGIEYLRYIHMVHVERLIIRIKPVLFYIRADRQERQRPDLYTLQYFLTVTATYRAFDNRDKVFALQSLLPTRKGNLIKVDYNEPFEDTFKRATARCYNMAGSLEVAGQFNFLVESQEDSLTDTDCPSWILDFTYSGAALGQEGRMTEYGPVSLVGFLHAIAPSHFQHYKNSRFNSSLRIIPFATSRTLYCAGSCLDRIGRTWSIPLLHNDTQAEFTKVMGRFVVDVIDADDERGMNSPKLREFHRPRTSSFPDEWSWVRFFTMFIEDDLFNWHDEVKVMVHRFHALAGKSVFVTEKGLVGIASKPVEAGDWLCLIHTLPMYLVLREVKGFEDEDENAQEHRIVARTAIYEKLYDMEAMIKSLPVRRFQIV